MEQHVMNVARWAVEDAAAAGSQCDSGVAQFTDLLERMRVRINAVIASAGLVRLDRSGQPSRFEPLAAVGAWNEPQISQLSVYLSRDGLFSDPAYARVSLQLTGVLGSTVWLRRDLVPDSEWYPTAYVRERRKPAGIDDELFACFPLPTAGEMVGATFHRALTQPPFSEPDRAYVTLVMHACMPLVRTIERDRNAQQVLTQLAPRLRLTLACLQLGDSAKEAAARLGLTPHTFREYTKSLYAAFKVRSRGELLARCTELRLRADLKDQGWLHKTHAKVKVAASSEAVTKPAGSPVPRNAVSKARKTTGSGRAPRASR